MKSLPSLLSLLVACSCGAEAPPYLGEPGDWERVREACAEDLKRFEHDGELQLHHSVELEGSGRDTTVLAFAIDRDQPSMRLLSSDITIGGVEIEVDLIESLSDGIHSGGRGEYRHRDHARPLSSYGTTRSGRQHSDRGHSHSANQLHGCGHHHHGALEQRDDRRHRVRGWTHIDGDHHPLGRSHDRSPGSGCPSSSPVFAPL